MPWSLPFQACPMSKKMLRSLGASHWKRFRKLPRPNMRLAFQEANPIENLSLASFCASGGHDSTSEGSTRDKHSQTHRIRRTSAQSRASGPGKRLESSRSWRVATPCACTQIPHRGALSLRLVEYLTSFSNYTVTCCEIREYEKASFLEPTAMFALYLTHLGHWVFNLWIDLPRLRFKRIVGDYVTSPTSVAWVLLL